MVLETLLPRQESLQPAEIRSWLDQTRTSAPFSPSVTSACAALSQRIMRERAAREYPELLALAFWIRPAEIQRLREDFAAPEPSRSPADAPRDSFPPSATQCRHHVCLLVAALGVDGKSQYHSVIATSLRDNKSAAADVSGDARRS